MAVPIRSSPAKPVQDAASLAVGEAQVQDHRLQRLVLQDLQGFSATSRLGDLEAGVAKGEPEHSSDAPVVLNDQHPKTVLMSSRFA
jgi:hypothetical protein